MGEYPVLKRAPITEALLDIQVDLPSDVDLAQLAKFQDEVRDRFPVRRERSMLQFQFEAREGVEPAISQSGGVNGYLFLSAERDPAKAVQARLDGFTFSKLKPYESWELFRDEAYELWSHYTDIARPIRIRRLGLRNINRIELPLPFNDFSDYLLTKPDIAPGVSSGVSEFLMRLVMPQLESSSVAIVTVATDSLQADDKILPVIFDIDVFVEAVYEPTSENVWATFEELRNIKNNIFFNSITEAARGLFQ